MIFRWLPKTCLVNCSLVCKRWSLLSEDDTLWTKIDCYRKNLAKGDLGRILSKKPIFLRLAASEVILSYSILNSRFISILNKKKILVSGTVNFTGTKIQ